MSQKKQRVVLLGATGSIGRQACDIIERHPDRFELVGAVAGSDTKALAEIQRRFNVPAVAVMHSDDHIFPVGEATVCEVARTECDIVCVAIPGAAALAPTLAALDAGRDIALATKEVLVAAGPLVKHRAAVTGSRIFPVDSEHSAIWQCLRGENLASVQRLILTASGGPFREWSRQEMAEATPEQALAHPNWDMGPKVTIDSATMMNKGLEIIEAHFLFDIPYSAIDVVVHPSSSVHSMVEFVDGATMAQIGIPDMHLPIGLALSGGERLPYSPPLAMQEARSLEFSPVDDERFPAVGLARRCGELGGLAPTVMNAANEVAVAAFLNGHIGFGDIVDLVGRVVDETPDGKVILDQIQSADRWARQRAEELAGQQAQV